MVTITKFSQELLKYIVVRLGDNAAEAAEDSEKNGSDDFVVEDISHIIKYWTLKNKLDVQNVELGKIESGFDIKC